MAEVAKGIIDIEINTGRAASQLQALQAQINAFNLALNKSNKAQGTFAAEYSRELQSAINKTGLFTAETIKLQTAAATLDKTLSRGKTSLGQFFSAKFNKDSAIAAETMALAAERAKRLQTQFIATSGAANGFQEAIAVRPLAAFSSEAAVAAQRTQILSNMFKQGTTQLINFGKNVQWAGRQLMVGFTVPLTIFGSVAGKTFMELEKQAVAFKKVYGDIFTTSAELNQNLEAVKGLAAEYTKYGIAVKDTIGLAAQAAAAGRQNADLTDAVSQATRLATLGQMDQNAALETTISLQSAFRLSGQDLADTINFLNMVENQTVVSLQDIAAAIPRVAPVIQGLGGDVKDLTVFLAAMQEGGVDAAEGANALKSGLASLINPTKQANEMLSGMGINLQSIIEANKGDLMGTVRSFAEALQGLDQFSRQQALEQVFGKFQYAKLGALFENISREGSQAQQVIATMAYSTEQLGSTADKELKTIEESFGVQLTGAVERFKLAIAPIGELFVRLAIPLVNFATKVAEGFNGLSDTQKQFAAIAAVVVGVVIPAVTMMTGLFLNLIGTLAKVGQGIALFGKGFITGGPVGAVKALTQSSKYLSLAEMDAAMAAQQLSGANEILNATLVEQAITGNAAAAAINNLTKAYSAMIATQGAASSLPGFTTAGASGARAKAGQMVVRSVQKRNSGGPIFMSDGKTVPGTGNTDTVPAMLTPGEFVVNKQATKNNLELLHSINNGNGPQKLNAGGMAEGIQYLSAGAAVKALRARNLLKAKEEAKNLADFVKIGMYSKEEILQNKATTNLVKGEFKKLVDAPRPTIARSSQLRSTAGTVSSPREIAEAFSGSVLFEKLGISTGLLPSELNKLLSTNASGANARDILRFIEISGEDFLGPLKTAYSASNGPGRINTAEITENVIETLRLIGNEEKITDDILREIIDSSISNRSVRDHVGRMRTDPAYTGLGRISGLSRNTTMRAEKLGIEVPKNEKGKVTSAAARRALIETAERDISRNLGRQVRIFRTDERAGDKIIYEVRDADTSESLLRFKSGDTFSTESIPEHSGALKYTSFRGTEEQANIARRMQEALARKEISQEQFDLFTKGGFNISHLNAGGSVVPGMGNKDTVPAMLTPGEFVVNKEATKNNLELLHQINNSQKLNKGGMAGTQYLNVGGMVAGLAPMAAGVGASMLPMTMAPEMGMFGQIAASTAAFVVAQKSVQAALMKFQKVSLKAVDSTGQVGEGFKKLFPQVSKLSPNILKFIGPLSGAGAAIALVGFGAYKLNKQINDASKAGGKLAAAMYGTADSTNAIAETFGRQTRAQQAMIAATEKATGQQVSEESQQISSQFIQSDAGKSLLKDISFVEASGKDAAIALRNQLSQAIIAGAITPEEARAIAIDIGTALDNERLAVEVSGKISQLMGPNGEKLTAENILKIQAEISPTVDISQIRDDAKSAYDDLNQMQKIFSVFKGGSAGFENQFKLEEVLTVNNSALSAQLNTVEFLNAAFKEGTITLENYKKALDDSKNVTGNTLNANAQILGFENNQSLIANADIEAQKKQDSPFSWLWNEGTALTAVEDQKTQVRAMLEASGAYTEEAINKIVKDFEEVGSTSWGKLLTGEWSPTDAQMVIDFQTQGLTTEEIDELVFKLGVIESLPDITTVIDFKNPNPKAIKELYSTYEQLQSAAAKGPLTQEVLIKATGMDIFNNEIMSAINALPSSVSIPIIMSVAWDAETNKKLNAKEGTSAEQNATLQDALLKKLKTSFGDLASKPGPSSVDKTGGGSEKSKLADLLKTLMERFRLQEMLIDKEAEGFSNRVKQLNREIELEERQVNLRQRGLDQLSKKEEAVNDAYNLRVEALDKVSESNSRISEQEKSRISLASALASGDIAAAATISGEMQQQSAQYQIEDARAALEKQRQVDLDSLTVSINGKLMTRKGIEFEIEQIQDRIYARGEEVKLQQDQLLRLEDRKLAVAKEREKVETRMYLLEQQKNILDLKKLNRKGKLDPADKQSLAEYTKFYNQNVDMYNAANPGANVARMANGGVAYRGSTEAPPALRMNDGFTVPGIGTTDKVPALLTPGEFVVRKSVADKNRGFLNQLNSQVFPAVGKGISSPTYSMPGQSVTNIPVNNTNVVSNSSPMYNSTYNVNVNVSGTNASPDDIANVVMAKLSNQNRGNLRSSRY